MYKSAWNDDDNDNYTPFAYSEPEQQSNGFDAMNGMDKFITIFDKVIIPLMDKGAKVSDTVARHLERNTVQQQNRELVSVVKQQQEQMQQLQIENQELKQNLHQVVQQISAQPQFAQLPQFAQSQQIIEIEPVETGNENILKTSTKKSKTN